MKTTIPVTRGGGKGSTVHTFENPLRGLKIKKKQVVGGSSLWGEGFYSGVDVEGGGSLGASLTSMGETQGKSKGSRARGTMWKAIQQGPTTACPQGTFQ